MSDHKFTLLQIPSVGNIQKIVENFPFSIDVTKGSYMDLTLIIRNMSLSILLKDHDIKEYSFAWISSGWSNRDLAYALHLYLTSTGTPHGYVEKNTSKITDCVNFALNKMPMPDTIFMSRSAVPKNLTVIRDVCGFPLIIKDVRGSQGKHSALVSNEKELLDKMRTLPKNKKFMFQRFIPNDYDWGIMVANGVVVSGERSYPQDGEFRNNHCNGAKECFVNIDDIPQNIKDIAIAASASLDLVWSRADIIIDKNTGKPYLLEVNRYPGITAGSTEVSGAYAFLSSCITHPRAHQKDIVS
jgi:hypothetical protein